jgi:hypothetical protein
MFTLSGISIACPQNQALQHNSSTLDEASITQMLTPWGDTQLYSSDVDWENAFGRRFDDLKALNRFKAEILAPTLKSAEKRLSAFGLKSSLPISLSLIDTGA